MRRAKSSKLCGRKKIQTLGIFLLIVVIYYFLQFFSLSRLKSDSQSWGKRLHFQQTANVLQVNDDGAEESEMARKAQIQNSNLGRGHQDQQETLPRGVHPSDASQYVKDSSGLFKCLQSQVQIPVERVNDDFCDCPDSSDEPGTSACPHGRFYCRTQLPNQDAQYVHSSKVNDGICDCCDGSDEWNGRQVPAPMQLHGRRGAVFHSPCSDRCGDVLQLLQHEERVRSQGLGLQARYLQAAAQNLSPRHLHKFGPKGVFYLLSRECYQHAAHDYLYTVCPFESVSQGRGSGFKRVLGRQGQWGQQKVGDYVLDMVGGDSALCPDGQSREARIRFLCGLEDRVISVIEDQKCRYVVRFSTPAAC
ncbi:hypothetical protein ACOMHN_011106 [Nucella lapillus]